jgi:hypothetical protein
VTITITRYRLALGVLIAALVGTGIAGAQTDNDNPFADVPDVGAADEAFFSRAVEWLWDNELTTGSPAGSDTFKPFDGITRGENATFDFRYDSNVVQPALDALDGRLVEAEAEIGALQAAVEPLVNSVGAFAAGNADVPIGGEPRVYQIVSLVAPATGIVLVTGTTTVDNRSGSADLLARCSLSTTAELDLAALLLAEAAPRSYQSLAGTRGYAVTTGETLTVNLVCDAFTGQGSMQDTAMTAIFAPT